LHQAAFFRLKPSVGLVGQGGMAGQPARHFYYPCPFPFSCSSVLQTANLLASRRAAGGGLARMAPRRL
jgi:hypothetical protein